MPLWTWIETRGTRKRLKASVSRDHRLLWGWTRLVLGLVQMAFTVTACVLLYSGFYERGLIACLVATGATVASRRLFAGQPDRHLEPSMGGRPSREAVVRRVRS